MSQTQPGQQAAVGRVVLYRNAFGLQGVMPAVVAITQETYVGGAWKKPEPPVGVGQYHGIMMGQQQSVMIGNPNTYMGASTPSNSQSVTDRDGEFFESTSMPPVKDGAVHLAVLTPAGVRYEYNVREGDGPGQWSWPPRV